MPCLSLSPSPSPLLVPYPSCAAKLPLGESELFLFAGFLTSNKGFLLLLAAGDGTSRRLKLNDGRGPESRFVASHRMACDGRAEVQPPMGGLWLVIHMAILGSGLPCLLRVFSLLPAAGAAVRSSSAWEMRRRNGGPRGSYCLRVAVHLEMSVPASR